MTPRIAAVQHGDFLEACQLIASGQPEPYFGMAYTLQVLDRLFRDRPHLVVSLDAPAYVQLHSGGLYVGLPRPRLPGCLPGTVAELAWAKRILKYLNQFAPTHLLLRTGGLLACRMLDYAVRRRISTLAVFASVFSRSGRYQRWTTDWLIKRLNDPAVFLVGNHRAPATATMTECGLDPKKAQAYDWPGGRHPRDYPVKHLEGSRRPELVYVGSIAEAKGVGDVIQGVALLQQRGLPVHLSVAGDGPFLPRCRELAAACQAGSVTFLGRIGNQDAFDLMLRSNLVCVPSRPEFTEGLPLTLTEALASRTPVVASDHPVFTRAFSDSQGLRFFRAADPKALADAAQAMLADADGYTRLSELTAAAFALVECKVELGHLIERWQQTFGATRG
jgi:glycosyltransferase involved in cell wall biosynthesis